MTTGFPLWQQWFDQPWSSRSPPRLQPLHGSGRNARGASRSLRPIRRALHFISTAATTTTRFNVVSGFRCQRHKACLPRLWRAR